MLNAICADARGADALLNGASITKIALSPTEGTLIWTIFAGPTSSTTENIPCADPNIDSKMGLSMELIKSLAVNVHCDTRGTWELRDLSLGQTFRDRNDKVREIGPD